MPRIEGKTINELLRVEDITGAEIIPMSVYDEELSAYVTCGITLDNLFKTIYGMIQNAESDISYIKDDMTSYVSELRAEDERLDEELSETNVKVAYNAEDLVLLHDHYHRINSYAYTNIGELWDNADDSYAYAHENIGRLDAEMSQAQEDITGLRTDVDNVTSYALEGIGHNEEMIVTSYERLSERITYEAEAAADLVATAYTTLDTSMQAAYEGLAYAISYAGIAPQEELEKLHAYAYTNVGRIDTEMDILHSYAYEGVGHNAYVNLSQDITLMNHANAISAIAQGLSYESYVNTIQSGHINTIYYENSNDAFNDWSNPDDDNVKPQP